jgi:outer membrane protein assembly factor BamE (lipoprotein component of BamABCDE complex)
MELLFYIIATIVIVCVLRNAAASGNAFRDNCQRIVSGMNVQDVLGIMGPPSYTKEHENGSYEFIYEKSEWKGWMRGGTQVRRMEVVFSSDDIVISVGRNNNCYRSGW